MRFLGIVDHPFGIAFPLHRRPRLKVVARGKGVPDAARSPTLTIEMTNAAQEAVEVTGVYASYIYGNALVEIAVGRRTVKLPLLELAGEPEPPRLLGPSESAI